MATALGLAVAIIAVVLYNYFQVRLDELGDDDARRRHALHRRRLRVPRRAWPSAGCLRTRTATATSIVAEINITPLTDIFLVLLIIFMITSSAMVEVRTAR